MKKRVAASKALRLRRNFPGLLIMASVILFASHYRARTPEDNSAAATYSHGVFRVSIPYGATRSGSGDLTVEILDPDDAVIGHATRAVQAHMGQGTWHADFQLSKQLAAEDLVWHRLRYRFRYQGENKAAIERIESISRILRTPVVHVISQNSYLAGATAAVRLIVTDSRGALIPGGGSVRIELQASGKASQLLFTGSLNRRGTANAEFPFPRGLTGDGSLHFAVDTAIGWTEFAQPIRLDDKVSILLTTEKPIYQPGQTIHVRALALDRADHEASAGRKLTFELEDSRGNKVFKKATQTDAYGIASAEFALADEVNLGAYHLRAALNEPPEDSHNTAEIALNVERYVLPKFKVALELGDKGSKSKHGYRPGDHVTGTVRANYFFGKPVDRAEISVKASGMDVALFEAGAANGRTDADGAYRFDIRLPNYFAGRPLSQGAARVLVEATVKDSAGHSESRGEPILVSESPLLITAVPEGGTLIPGIENQVFILTSYPDGTPVQADVRVRSSGNFDQTASTDNGGVAIVQLAGHAGETTLQVEASGREGERASASIPLESRSGSDQVLLRAERALYRVGERMQLKVFSTKQRGSVYLDLIKDGQTVGTHDLDIVNGEAIVDLPATPGLAGTVEINAYLFGEDAVPIGDHRLVFVQPADELKVETALDCPVYKPGDEARIAFRVTNTKGQGVQAALGLQIVDEAVFALAEKQPGFAKVFFYLEQELMKPRYEIHSLDMRDSITSAAAAQSGQHDRAARVLFSATELIKTNAFTADFGRDIQQAKSAEYAARYRTRFDEQMTRLANAMNASLRKNSDRGNLDQIIARMQAADSPDLQDAWGGTLRFIKGQAGSGFGHFWVRSAGPDGHFETEDDLGALLQIRRRTGTVAKVGGIDLKIEHDRGAVNGLAQIVGVFRDEAEAVVAGATISIRDKRTGIAWTAIANLKGEFTLSGLPPGAYRAQGSSPGFETARADFSLTTRDRAILDVLLKVGQVEQQVEVTGGSGSGMAVVGGTGAPGGAAGIGAALGRTDGTHLGIGNIPLPAPMNEVAMRQFTVNGRVPPPPPSARASASAAPTAHVRSFFTEALYINPEIITDHDGRATITVPLADNITTWQLAMLASTAHGALGNATSSLKVFQDFFADLDLPVTLTQGDQVSIPIAIYNYSGSAGKVNLQLQPEDWFALVADKPSKTVDVAAGRVGGSQFTIEAKRIGKFKLTLTADMSGAAKRADIIVREIEVVPNGRERDTAFNGRLETTVRQELNFPPASIPDARAIFVRLYPGPLSQVVEGMDSLLQMPFGCFEQTSSSTYPNVLALDYMKRTKKLTPEVHAKAEGYIANGYQRLLTFEVPGGGFSWFGNAPANKILTSYGLMEFSDMAKVYEVDQRLITRTQQWLAGQQQADGSWKPDESFINEGATNRYNKDVLRITAYVAWALQDTGFEGPAVDKAKQFVEAHLSEKTDAYTLAVAANFAAEGKDRAFTSKAMRLLLNARTEKEEQAWWNVEETGVFATGRSAAVETTGLAAQALLKWGDSSDVTRKAMNYIAAAKDASGTWGTTQATIMALRALLRAAGAGTSAKGSLEIVWNGKQAAKLDLTSENNDLLHQFVLKGGDVQSANVVEIRFTGQGSMAYQLAGRYFLPWNEKPAGEPLSIEVNYDRTHLNQDDIATATATVRNNLDKTAKMVMVDLGIPPGFELLSEDLQTYQEKSAGRNSGRLEKFSLTATQAILYFDSIAPRDAFEFSFRLRAKYPIRARTFASRVYEYYDPDVSSLAKPIQLEVFKKP